MRGIKECGYHEAFGAQVGYAIDLAQNPRRDCGLRARRRLRAGYGREHRRAGYVSHCGNHGGKARRREALRENHIGEGLQHVARPYNEGMIYYVEDDANIRELSLYALRQAGLEARGFAEAGPFFSACAEALPDLVLLDIMLPGVDGLEILAEIRENPTMRDVPIMMLTAKGTEYDTVTGLDAGADDYLAKPFGMMELVSRCNALLRRARRSPNAEARAMLHCGRIELDESAHEAYANGVPLDLTPKEFDLLRKLLLEQGCALSRAQLLEAVWNISFIGGTRTVDTHVQTLRRKLNDAYPGAGNLVQTVRGVGYRIRADRQ